MTRIILSVLVSAALAACTSDPVIDTGSADTTPTSDAIVAVHSDSLDVTITMTGDALTLEGVGLADDVPHFTWLFYADVESQVHTVTIDPTDGRPFCAYVRADDGPWHEVGCFEERAE